MTGWRSDWPTSSAAWRSVWPSVWSLKGVCAVSACPVLRRIPCWRSPSRADVGIATPVGSSGFPRGLHHRFGAPPTKAARRQVAPDLPRGTRGRRRGHAVLDAGLVGVPVASGPRARPGIGRGSGADVRRPSDICSAVLVWFKFDWREMAVVSWAGLHGAVPIVLATIPLTAGHPDGEVVFDVASWWCWPHSSFRPPPLVCW